jgi:hypothetical protein
MARDPNHEVRLNYEKSLGPELGSIFAELWQELVWLHTVWREYRVIFGSSPEQLDIANQAASSFFYMVEESLREGVFLNLARLTDPPQSAGKSNLSVTRLRELVKPELEAELVALIEAAKEATSFARDWRNRYIAHTHLPLAMGDKGAAPLESASRAAVERALTSLDEVMNTIEFHYNGATTMYSGVKPHNGAKRLLQLLQGGMSAEEAERAARIRR